MHSRIMPVSWYIVWVTTLLNWWWVLQAFISFSYFLTRSNTCRWILTQFTCLHTVRLSISSPQWMQTGATGFVWWSLCFSSMEREVDRLWAQRFYCEAADQKERNPIRGLEPKQSKSQRGFQKSYRLVSLFPAMTGDSFRRIATDTASIRSRTKIDWTISF